MFAANTYVIRHATPADAPALHLLSILDSARALEGDDILIGEIAGEPVAAVSLASGRVIADPFEPTAQLVARLRMRAEGLKAAGRTPSVAERIRSRIHVAGRAPAPQGG